MSADDGSRCDHCGALLAPTSSLPHTMSVPDAGHMLGIARGASYRAAARGELPVIKVGGKLRVPTYRLLEMLEGR